MEKSALIFVFLTLGTVGFALLIQSRVSAPAFLNQGRRSCRWNPPTRRDAVSAVAEFAIFSLLTAVSACRFALGNDYWVYRENFRRIFYDAHVSSEIGFNLVVKGLFHLFGYDNYLPLFAFFSLVTVFPSSISVTVSRGMLTSRIRSSMCRFSRAFMMDAETVFS